MKNAPLAHTVFDFLRANCGPHCCAGLTGQDNAALRAAVQIVPLWNPDGNAEEARTIAAAFGACVRLMQPKEQGLAYHAIAHVFDWSTRRRLWAHAGFTGYPSPLYRCKYDDTPEGR